MEQVKISDEMRRAQAEFHQLVHASSAHDLRRPSNGTRWTNRQLLFHMVLGYAVVRTLLPLVRTLGRLGHSRGFAATLNAGRQPFHLINYLGSCVGGQILSPRAMTAVLDWIMRGLQRTLAAETERSLALTMHVPTAWDPYFKPTMSVLDVYHFGTQHFDHHRRQLTLEGSDDA
ncbi:DinB family protein [Pseudonocardia sp. DSM 110487]|uniref:DinB family protein n=1 Tax=Pseudonocardia sp. DSM 110487 TaxID=2865833 RepID=UPI001C6A2E62|nr:DinB family protein [Pseudonocardia sp. DSM 110487]QYN36261.1 DinB family protein [Pseudonocardia sp. DSM 110487]